MDIAILYTHFAVVTIFLLIYLIKTFLLLTDKKEQLAKFTKSVKVPEMIVSFLFLATGIYLLIPLIKIDAVSTLLIIKIVIVLASIPIAVVGFKKQNKMLALLAFIMIVAAFGLGEVSYKERLHPTTTNDNVAKPADGLSADGQQIYSANCAKCHGDDGKAGILGASDLSVSAMDANVKLEIVKNGKGTMPAFAGQLSEEQIGAVVGYIQTLKK